MKAVDTAEITPTAANLDKARKALEALSPAAQELVIRLEQLRPTMESLQATAANGLFPGVLDGMDALKSRLPDIRHILDTVSHATGDLFSQAGHDLASSRFNSFFTFLAAEVPATLHTVGLAVASVAHGLAQMWMAFTPLNHGFNDFIVNAARAFDSFATNLTKTQGFTDFIDYIRQNGPQVEATAGAIANALVQIVQAAAPIGGPVLQGVELLANALAKIADSSLGTPIFGAIAALGALSLATRAFGPVADFAFKGKAAAGITSFTGGVTKARSSISSLASDLNVMGTTYMTAGANSERASARLKESTDRVTQAAVGVGKGIAVAAGLALATTGIADKMGFANTATLGLIGTMGGPYGAAAGAAVGFALDVAKANNDVASAVEHANQVLKDAPSAFAAQNQAIDEAIAKQQEFAKSAAVPAAQVTSTNPFDFSHMANVDQLKNLFSLVTTGTSEVDKQKQSIIALENEQAGLVTSWTTVAEAFGSRNVGFDAANASLNQLSGLATRIQPAMNALGISFEDLQKAAGDPSQLHALVQEIEGYNKTADSTKGRTEAFIQSLTGLNSQLLSTGDSANGLSDALNNLFGPKLNAEQAADALTKSLQAMESTLKGNTKTFQGNTKAALDNRAATRQAFSDTLASLTAQAQAGAGAKQIANSLRESRQRFIEEGIAAGYSAKQMAARAKALGLTPKLVATVFKAVGLDLEQGKLRDLMSSIKKLPKGVQTELKTNGYDLSKSQITDLTKKYNLTPKEVSTLLSASDKASELIKYVQGLADKLDHTNAKPSVAVQGASAASAAVNGVLQQLNLVNGYHADSYITVHHSNTYGGPAGGGGHSVGTPGAHGRVLDFYAGGDIRDRHVAEIAPAGSWRVWAEPETKGESYIPLADDWRRPRAQDIWRETGRRLGMQFMEFARGAVISAPMQGREVARVSSAGFFGPVEVRGRVDIATGSLVGTMRMVADQAIDESNDFNDTMRGRRAR